MEGKYVIQTEELDLSAVEAVQAYKELSEVERSFRETAVRRDAMPTAASTAGFSE